MQFDNKDIKYSRKDISKNIKIPLFLVSVSITENAEYYDIEKNKRKMIKSDYLLLKKYLNSNLKIPVIISQS